MSKIKLLLDVVEDMRSLADSLNAVADALMESEAAPEPEVSDYTESTSITEEQIRDVLVRKSQEGFKEECRALILKYGASNVTNLNRNHYADVLREAEAIGNAT